MPSSGHHKKIKKLEKGITEKKDELKNLVKLQTTRKLDDEVYNEEYFRISEELKELRDTNAEFEQDENRKEELLEQFDKDIFNALVDKIEIIESTHFVFSFSKEWILTMDVSIYNIYSCKIYHCWL